MAKTPSQRVTDTRRRHRERGGIRVDIFLSQAMGEQLDAYRARTGVSRAEGIREILTSKLEDQK